MSSYNMDYSVLLYSALISVLKRNCALEKEH